MTLTMDGGQCVGFEIDEENFLHFHLGCDMCGMLFFFFEWLCFYLCSIFGGILEGFLVLILSFFHLLLLSLLLLFIRYVSFARSRIPMPRLPR